MYQWSAMLSIEIKSSHKAIKPHGTIHNRHRDEWNYHRRVVASIGDDGHVISNEDTSIHYMKSSIQSTLLQYAKSERVIFNGGNLSQESYQVDFKIDRRFSHSQTNNWPSAPPGPCSYYAEVTDRHSRNIWMCRWPRSGHKARGSYATSLLNRRLGLEKRFQRVTTGINHGVCSVLYTYKPTWANEPHHL